MGPASVRQTGERKGAETLGSIMTERGRYRFVPKESAHGHFWVAAEPAGDMIKSLDDCVLGFDLEPGASHGHAVAVADFMSDANRAHSLVR